MTKNFVAFPTLLLVTAALAGAQGQAPTKVGYINIQQAILATKDGQKASADMNTKFGPRRSELEKKKAELDGLQDQLRKGSATMSDEAKNKLARDMDTINKELTRGNEDFQAEVENEEGKLMNDLGQKMLEVVSKYAAQNGYAMILDVNPNQQTVLWADPSVNITAECVKLYDQAHPGTGAAPTAAAPKPGSAAAPATQKPSTPAAPPSKKQ